MKLAIMQPYFFPYLGYFQLAHSVDSFVVYDDVHFSKGGWVNRNYILSQAGRSLLTLNLSGASSNRLINEIAVGDNKEKILKTVRQQYSKAPYFELAYPVIEDIFSIYEPNLASFLGYGVQRICHYLGIRDTWYWSSEIAKDGSLKGQDKVIDICKKLGAEHYVNLPGGRNLYGRERFEDEGMELSFIEPGNYVYKQYSRSFVPNLSIIDVIMFNDPKDFPLMLSSYSIV
ncbi:WbqC-like protein family protein [Thiohalospira halophila DSM 15071]|uniref:WbqC-like protein family protein n=1 Tax=Thiohalospira halophila DSM 15071 TaxID=1123397 RepID=A0A1I1WIU9_9GAMM|nr:WbqC family protein [Thiohalospira halophila]SFD93030.1 WbqC-like protein family protein [Thiohalospira halophila DSM 15071]